MRMPVVMRPNLHFNTLNLRPQQDLTYTIFTIHNKWEDNQLTPVRFAWKVVIESTYTFVYICVSMFL